MSGMARPQFVEELFAEVGEAERQSGHLSGGRRSGVMRSPCRSPVERATSGAASDGWTVQHIESDERGPCLYERGGEDCPFGHHRDCLRSALVAPLLASRNEGHRPFHAVAAVRFGPVAARSAHLASSAIISRVNATAVAISQSDADNATV